jgi:hypothetical protein
MPFQKACQTCGTDFVSPKRTAKYCCSRCFGLSQIARTVAQNKARRKYQEVPGLTKSQASYRGRNGADSLRDVRKRQELLVALGGKCVTCGYSADLRGLVLDHKNGDGHEDRKRLGPKVFRYYINHLDEARKKLQVLCATCNQIKSFENREHNRSRRVVEI